MNRYLCSSSQIHVDTHARRIVPSSSTTMKCCSVVNNVVLSSTMWFYRPFTAEEHSLSTQTPTTSNFRQRSCPTPTVTLPHLVHLVFLKAQLTPLPSFVILPGTLPVQFRPLAKLYISGIYGLNSELLAVTPNHFYLSIIILLSL